MEDRKPLGRLVFPGIKSTSALDLPNEQPLPGEERLFAYLGKHGRSLG